MAGNKEGARKAKETNLKLYGPNFYKEIGAMSWDDPDRSHNVGFALRTPEERAEMGRKGGKTNKGKTYVKKEAPIPTKVEEVNPGVSE